MVQFIYSPDSKLILQLGQRCSRAAQGKYSILCCVSTASLHPLLILSLCFRDPTPRKKRRAPMCALLNHTRAHTHPRPVAPLVPNWAFLFLSTPTLWARNVIGSSCLHLTPLFHLNPCVCLKNIQCVPPPLTPHSPPRPQYAQCANCGRAWKHE